MVMGTPVSTSTGKHSLKTDSKHSSTMYYGHTYMTIYMLKTDSKHSSSMIYIVSLKHIMLLYRKLTSTMAIAHHPSSCIMRFM
jgi:hypothetical protein